MFFSQNNRDKKDRTGTKETIVPGGNKRSGRDKRDTLPKGVSQMSLCLNPPSLVGYIEIRLRQNARRHSGKLGGIGYEI